MELVVISASEKLDDEIKTIIGMFECGLHCFHIRKPNYELNEMKKMLVQIPAHFHPFIVLHSAYELGDTFRLKGFHYPKSLIDKLPKEKPAEGENHKSFTYSKSFHSFNEIDQNLFAFDYAFLSPVFNSISKANHPSAFEETEIRRELPGIKAKNKNMQIFALGGIDLQKIEKLYDYQFDGVGVIGSIWNKPNFASKIEAFKSLQKRCSELS
jgi:thiamine-phosphate pyrophosphorylase